MQLVVVRRHLHGIKLHQSFNPLVYEGHDIVTLELYVAAVRDVEEVLVSLLVLIACRAEGRPSSSRAPLFSPEC